MLFPEFLVPKRVRAAAVALLFALPASAALAEPGFAPGWKLDPTMSNFTFQSVKNGSKVETSTFARYDGTIAPDGTATLKILLDSVDTGVDLRNVRMRFLFFETFKFPEAVVTVKLDPGMIPKLLEKRRVTMPLAYDLELHGVTKTLQAQTVVTLITEEIVSVASAAPIPIAAALFGMEDGVRKLEDAADVKVVPSGSISFDLVFVPDAVAVEPEPVVAAASPEPAAEPDPAPAPVATLVAATAAAPAPTPAAVAVERSGNFSLEECAGRFEIISRSNAIYFGSGSAEIEDDSRPFLTSVIDIAKRCPDLGIVVEGHTDSAGSASFNQNLSEARAASVMRYLVANGLEQERLDAVGFGEARPVAPNDTAWNRSRNRRIQFAVAAN